MLSTTDFPHCTPRCRRVELTIPDLPKLQAFFEQNPHYFVTSNGQPPTSTEAQDEMDEPLPDGWPFTKKWILGFVDPADALVGMATVISDLLAPGVWHIGLLIVATNLHGTGAASSIYADIEGWAGDAGARWLRLGVIAGNARAESFWRRCGFREVRQSTNVEMGCFVHTLRVLVKPLTGGTMSEYIELVAHDRPCRTDREP